MKIRILCLFFAVFLLTGCVSIQPQESMPASSTPIQEDFDTEVTEAKPTLPPITSPTAPPLETTLPETTATETNPPETAVPETTVPPETTIPTESTVPPETEALHSELYIPGVRVEDVIVWFREVCLDAEFSNNGNPSLIQKWQLPIQYQIQGEPTPEDLNILKDFCEKLNAIHGFPGISETDNAAFANLQIHFCSADELISILGDQYYGTDGGVIFWYQNNAIYDETICIRTDLDQHVRNSVIQEELYNGLGPVQDTTLRTDSLIYSYYSTPQEPTAVDMLILKLLYHPQILCGMNAEECERIIRQLYY